MPTSPPRRRPSSRVPAVLLVALAAMTALTACGGEPGAGGAGGARDDGVLRVVATTSILGDLVGDLVGADGEVEVLIPAGADPHSFAASPAQGAALRRADLVVAIGLGLEASLDDVLSAAAADGAVIFEVGPLLDPLLSGEGDGDEGDGADGHGIDDGHGHAAGEFDPHVWFDPTRMALAAELVAARLATTTDGSGAADWQERGAEVADALRDLDAAVATVLDAVPQPRRLLVTNHDALGYLADRYGFDVVATVIPGTSTQAQPSAGDVAALAELLRDLDVPAIFVDRESSSDVARTLADDLGGVEVVSLYTGALGGPGSGADTYAELMTATARAIADALS